MSSETGSTNTDCYTTSCRVGNRDGDPTESCHCHHRAGNTNSLGLTNTSCNQPRMDPLTLTSSPNSLQSRLPLATKSHTCTTKEHKVNKSSTTTKFFPRLLHRWTPAPSAPSLAITILNYKPCSWVPRYNHCCVSFLSLSSATNRMKEGKPASTPCQASSSFGLTSKTLFISLVPTHDPVVQFPSHNALQIRQRSSSVLPFPTLVPSTSPIPFLLSTSWPLEPLTLDYRKQLTQINLLRTLAALRLRAPLP